MYEEKKSSNTGLIISIIVSIIIILAAAGVCVFLLLSQSDSSYSSEVEESLAKGQELLDDGEYEDAITEFESALEEDNMCIEAYTGIVDAYIELEEYDAARDVIEEAMELFEDDGTRMDVRKIEKLSEKVDDADGPKTVDPPEIPGGTGEPVIPGGTDGPDTVEPDRIQILTDFYNTEKSRNAVIEKDQVFEEACGYMPAKGERPAYALVGSGIEGYVADIFYDFDMDGEDELVIAYYYKSDEFGIEVYDVQNGKPEKTFMLNEIEGGLCGIDEERFNDTADIEIGLCQKDGKVFITETTKYTSSVFSKYFRNEMYIYEVNGSGADCVFFDYVAGANQNDMLNNPYMMEAYRGFPNKLRNFGFNSTANELSYDMSFSAAENITSLVFGCSRHCGTYENFNAKGGSSNAGRKAFVFSENVLSGHRAMDSAH